MHVNFLILLFTKQITTNNKELRKLDFENQTKTCEKIEAQFYEEP
jgi:hypothetical protein